MTTPSGPLSAPWTDGGPPIIDPLVTATDLAEAIVITVEQAYAKGQRDERAKFVNLTCVWGEGKCIPDCPTCRELDAAYAEREAGAGEENRRIRTAVVEYYKVAPKAAEPILHLIDETSV